MKKVKKDQKLNFEQYLKKIRVKRIKYYYYKTELVNNVCTVCLFLDENNEVMSRGVSICSVLDTFNKKKGRSKSLSRALKAIEEKKDSLKIEIMNSHRWKQKNISRKFNIKNKNDFKYFEKQIIPLIDTFYIKKIQNGKKLKMFFKIPRNYSIRETHKLFNFKASYKSELTADEMSMLK